MKTWTKFWLFMPFILMYLSIAGIASAANPTIYTSIPNKDYGRAGQGDSHGNVVINNTYQPKYIQYFRVFVPPGAVLITLEILEWNGQSVIAHHETPPTSAFGQIAPSSSYTLSSLEAADQYYPGQLNNGRLAILSDGFAAPYLSAARGGWLYVKVDQKINLETTYYNAVSFTVNADAYNNWYDHSGSNPDGSINWATDVEGVTEYLEPNARPGKPEVTPANNTVWTSGTTQTITATSSKATNIYGTFTSSGDVNNPPADPRIPSPTDFDISGSGTSLSADLAGTTDGIVMYKYRFISANSSGLSDESGVYSYSIDLRPVTRVVSVAPTTRDVAKDAGTTSFSVSNTGTGIMPWTAAVISGSSWLSITSGASGSNSGTITCSYSANTAISSRMATIRITANGAMGSPVDVTVTQAKNTQPVLSVSPGSRDVAKDAGTTSFNVSNSGTGTMPWTAAVRSGDSWLSITSGASGSNSGTITCNYSTNASASSRTATISITAGSATGSPVDVTVTQAPTTTPSPKRPIPDTGQTKCYDSSGSEITCPSPGQALYGQDANYTINPMSYTKLDDSGNVLPDSAPSWVMVKDNVTGLIWEMKTNMDGIKNYNDPHDADNTYTWYDPTEPYPGIPGDGTDTKDFIDALNNAHFGGYSDWRLPSIKELAYIVNYNIPKPGPTIDITYFPNTQASYYWSATTYAYYPEIAWHESFYNGNIDDSGYKINTGYVRAVRGEQSQSVYVNNGNGTVTDTSTGLMWQQNTSDNKMTWEQALSYCENLSLAGYTDWRLPSKKELQNLVDYNRYAPAIDTTYFPNTFQSSYWSATTSNQNTNDSWEVYFYTGDDTENNKTDSFYVRTVRGGQAICTPDIKVNGQDGQITVSSGTSVSIAVSLASGDQNAMLADWWLVASTPLGFYSFTFSGWHPETTPLVQYPLFDLSPLNIFEGSLPAGDYEFYFGVDTSPNGLLDLPLYYDFVQVRVVN
ncbi:MAG: DUF1566 domain-containing protein [Deltaproteobacteria bacterium]|nr:DUF1566 domain-containing protein [Deltaproteobacteria bacterium]